MSITSVDTAIDDRALHSTSREFLNPDVGSPLGGGAGKLVLVQDDSVTKLIGGVDSDIVIQGCKLFSTGVRWQVR